MADNDGKGHEIKPEKPPDSAPAEAKDGKEKLEVEKKKVELEILKMKKEKLECFSRLLSILVMVFSVSLIVEGVYFFVFFHGDRNNAVNWIRLLFGSLLTVSFVVLIIVLCRLFKSLLSNADEE